MPDIADLIGDILGDQDDLGVVDATLTKVTPGGRLPGAYSAGTNPTSTDYAGRGFIEAIGMLMDGTLVQQGNVVISLLGGTFAAVPAPTDAITIASKEFPAGHRYAVVRVVADAVGAVYQCEARR